MLRNEKLSYILPHRWHYDSSRPWNISYICDLILGRDVFISLQVVESRSVVFPELEPADLDIRNVSLSGHTLNSTHEADVCLCLCLFSRTCIRNISVSRRMGKGSPRFYISSNVSSNRRCKF